MMRYLMQCEHKTTKTKLVTVARGKIPTGMIGFVDKTCCATCGGVVK